jgi:phosphoglycolate phosphatase-like HAD superfamily hydrolase
LVLWDIDGTLLYARGFGSEAFRVVTTQVLGIEPTPFDMTLGNTDRGVIIETLNHHDIAVTEEIIADFQIGLVTYYQQRLADLKARTVVHQGAKEAVARLHGHSHVRQSLLTGNLPELARMKLEAIELDSYLNLDIGAYGNDHADRAKLVSFAIKRYSAKFNKPIAPEHITLIGDTPEDVRAATESGANVIAVATGEFSVAELKTAGAATVLESLAEMPRALPVRL